MSKTNQVLKHDEEIESVKSFKYPGSSIEADGGDTKQIKWRLAMVSKKLIDMEKLWNNKMKLGIV